jgi:hypothetical protein
MLGLHSYYIEQYHLCSCIHLFAEACQECWVHLFVSTYNWNLSLSLSIADFVIHSMNQVSRRIKHNRRLQPLICMLQMYIWSFESFRQYCIVQANTDCSCPLQAWMRVLLTSFFLSYISWMLVNLMIEPSHCFQKWMWELKTDLV